MKNNGLGFAVKTRSMNQNQIMSESHSEAILLLDSNLDESLEAGATFGRGIIKKLNFEGGAAAADNSGGPPDEIFNKGSKKSVRFEPASPDKETKLLRFMQRAESFRALGL